MLQTNIRLEKFWQNTQQLNVMRCSLSDEKLKINEIHQEKGESIWLLTLPLNYEGYCLDKQKFWDLLWSYSMVGHYHDVLCTTCFVLQKRQFYNPNIQPYRKCNRWVTLSSFERCARKPVLHSLIGETIDQKQ